MTRTDRHDRAKLAALPESGFFRGQGRERHGETRKTDDDDPTVLNSVGQLGMLPTALPPPPPRRGSVQVLDWGSEVQQGNLISEYLVERVVGRMGPCVVVKVRHARAGQRFLLKYLGPEAGRKPDAVRQFLNGAQAAMRLRSEYIARTVDAGLLQSGAPYLVTEAFQGSELREILRVRGALTQTEAVDFVLQAAEAIAEAHHRGLTHGSLSPSTLFVTRRSDGLPIIKVLEFGNSETLRAAPLAVQLRGWNHGTAAFWESSRLWDTLAYSAPEQLRGSSAPPPLRDVWALGATLHELLSGAPAFHAASASSLLAAIVADAPAPLTSLCAGLPRALEAIVLRCLSKEPHARFPSVADLAAALREFASPEAQLVVDRIARIQSYDPQRSPLSSPSASRAIVRVGASPVPKAAPPPASVAQPSGVLSAQRSLGFLLVGSAALAALGVLGGTVAGAVVARSALLHAQASSAVPSPSVLVAKKTLPIVPPPPSASAIPSAPRAEPVPTSTRAAPRPRRPASSVRATEPQRAAVGPSSSARPTSAPPALRAAPGLFDQMD